MRIAVRKLHMLKTIEYLWSILATVSYLIVVTFVAASVIDGLAISRLVTGGGWQIVATASLTIYTHRLNRILGKRLQTIGSLLAEWKGDQGALAALAVLARLGADEEALGDIQEEHLERVRDTGQWSANKWLLRRCTIEILPLLGYVPRE